MSGIRTFESGRVREQLELTNPALAYPLGRLSRRKKIDGLAHTERGVGGNGTAAFSHFPSRTKKGSTVDVQRRILP